MVLLFYMFLKLYIWYLVEGSQDSDSSLDSEIVRCIAKIFAFCTLMPNRNMETELWRRKRVALLLCQAKAAVASRILTPSLVSTIQLSHSVVSDSLWPHGLQQARLPCPSPTPGVWSNSCPSSQWCHPTISSSVIPFSRLQSFQASRSFPMSQILAAGGQSIGVSASTSVFPMNIQDWSPIGWTALISLLSKGLSRAFSNTTVQKHRFFSAQLSL